MTFFTGEISLEAPLWCGQEQCGSGRLPRFAPEPCESHAFGYVGAGTDVTHSPLLPAVFCRSGVSSWVFLLLPEAVSEAGVWGTARTAGAAFPTGAWWVGC